MQKARRFEGLKAPMTEGFGDENWENVRIRGDNR
jgi:hypothetical protein